MRPRKGQFVVLDKSASTLVGAIVLRVPTERTKGILLARTVFGNLLLGPTAEETDDRRRAPVDGVVLAELLQAGTAMVPDLPQHAVTASYAGLRPATEHLDYQLWHDARRGWITLAGIRSTGLTAALGLAEWAADKAAAILGRLAATPSDDALDWPAMPNLSEASPRPYQEAGRGEIVCHCEWVTEPEIRRACEGAVPAGTIGGLKRRTRAMMGRCQGFNCMGKVVRIAGPLGHAGELHPPAG
jgi:glycerol-3-phosphate dehydrogenase